MISDELIPPPPALLAQYVIYPVFRLLMLPLTRGATVTSGYRSSGHNVEVGGVLNSAHESGVALDVLPADPAILSSFRAAFPGAIAIDEGDHYHLALPRAAAWLILLLIGAAVIAAWMVSRG